MVVAVVSIPLVIRGLGAPRFGILSLAWVVLGYFGLFDLGLGRAATRFVAEALGRGDHDAVPGIAWTAVVTQSVLGLAGAAALAAATPLLVDRILSVPPELQASARLSFYVLAAAVPVVLVAGSFRGVLEAAQRFDLSNAVRAPASALNFLLPLVGVWLGWDLPAIVALLVAARTAALLAFFILCVRVFPALAGAPAWRAGQARALLGFGSWISVSGVLSPVLIYVDRVMIGALVSLAAVAYYTAPYEMITRLSVVPASLATALFPTFTSITSDGRSTEAHHLAARSVKMLLLVLGPAVVVAIVFAHDILGLWLGTELAAQGVVALQILSVGVLFNALATVPYTLVQAVGRPDLTAKFHLIELPLHVLAAWLLVTRFGIPGAALAWSLRTALDALLLFGAGGRLAVLPATALREARIPRALVLLAVLAAAACGAGVGAHGLALRLPLVLASLTAGAAAAWRWVADDDDRARVVRLARRVARRGG